MASNQVAPITEVPGDSKTGVQGLAKTASMKAKLRNFQLLAFRQSNTWKRISKCALFLHVCIYFVIGIVGFKFAEEDEEWTYTDGLYFTMMTMSTVGYGDISPSSVGTRVFTLFMIFWGIIFIFPSIAAAIAPVAAPVQERIQEWLERKFPATKVDIDGDGDADYSVPRAPAIFYFKQLSPSLSLNVGLQLVFAGIFVAIEENWNYFDAVYHCLVTATTVGYGDQTIETQGGRLWASVHMAVSVCLLGEMISRIDDARNKRKAELARVEQLRRRLDEQLLERLQQRAAELRPQVDHSGGLSELEFVLCMVLELEMLELGQLRPFIKQFRALDINGQGSLDADDLHLHKTLSEDQIASMRSNNFASRAWSKPSGNLAQSYGQGTMPAASAALGENSPAGSPPVTEPPPNRGSLVSDDAGERVADAGIPLGEPQDRGSLISDDEAAGKRGSMQSDTTPFPVHES